MADRTGIEWTGSTWTTIRARNRATGRLGWHCVHVSPGCKHCYAESWNKPRGTGLPFKPGHAADVEIILDERMLLQPLRWRAPRKIFVCSMTDLFADFVPDEMIDRVFAVMALAPQHTFQVLTKRAARMRDYLTDSDLSNRISAALGCMLDGDWVWTEGKRFRQAIERLIDVFAGMSTDDDGNIVYHDDPWPLPNVWLGVSAEDQRRADERVPDLLATPAAIRFVSAEPLLGPIDFTRLGNLSTIEKAFPEIVLREKRTHPRSGDGSVSGFQLEAVGGAASSIEFFQTPDHMGGFSAASPRRFPRLDWIIVGGESGKGARPMHPGWARAIRDQCAAAGTAFFFKQWGEYGPCETHPPGTAVCSVIASSGRHLQGPEAVWGEPGDGRAEIIARFGKARAGRLLDGVEHNAMPEVRP